MPADVAIHRTDVQAGAAADAMQHFPFFGVGQQAAAAVIEQHNVKLFRAVGFAQAPGAAGERAVRGDRLPRA